MAKIPSPTLDQQISLQLLTLRKAREFSLAQLAERSGVSKAKISRIERAQTSATAALLSRLAAGLGVSPYELLSDIEMIEILLPRCAATSYPCWHDRPYH